MKALHAGGNNAFKLYAFLLLTPLTQKQSCVSIFVQDFEHFKAMQLTPDALVQ